MFSLTHKYYETAYTIFSTLSNPPYYSNSPIINSYHNVHPPPPPTTPPPPTPTPHPPPIIPNPPIIRDSRVQACLVGLKGWNIFVHGSVARGLLGISCLPVFEWSTAVHGQFSVNIQMLCK